MPAMKTSVKTEKRGTLNTTINNEILEGFKKYCKATGIPMNIILESFMSQFVAGEFAIKIQKNKLMITGGE